MVTRLGPRAIIFEKLRVSRCQREYFGFSLNETANLDGSLTTLRREGALGGAYSTAVCSGHASKNNSILSTCKGLRRVAT